MKHNINNKERSKNMTMKLLGAAFFILHSSFLAATSLMSRYRRLR